LTSQLLDPTRRAWRRDVLGAFGLPPAHSPAIGRTPPVPRASVKRHVRHHRRRRLLVTARPGTPRAETFGGFLAH
jgi:hypothetical protein